MYKKIKLFELIGCWARLEARIYSCKKNGFTRKDNTYDRLFNRANKMKKKIFEMERETFTDTIDNTKDNEVNMSCPLCGK